MNTNCLEELMKRWFKREGKYQIMHKPVLPGAGAKIENVEIWKFFKCPDPTRVGQPSSLAGTKVDWLVCNSRCREQCDEFKQWYKEHIGGEDDHK